MVNVPPTETFELVATTVFTALLAFRFQAVSSVPLVPIRAMEFRVVPPIVVNAPPTYTLVPDTANVLT